MADSLPLIPAKGGVCADVRPVLREVFKELDFLPPLAPERHKPKPIEDDDNDSTNLPNGDHWINKYNSEHKDIWNREGELQHQYAKRIARDPLPNIYKLFRPLQIQEIVPIWKSEQGVLDRKDLMPTLAQNAGVDDCLWVKNILNRSSGNLSSVSIRGLKVQQPVRLDAIPMEDSLLSVSIGDMPVAPQMERLALVTPTSLPTKETILCMPPQLDFINFTVGELHTQGIRLVNVAKFEVRLSIRPPKLQELNVELAGTRGLTVTSGAAADILVHFRPKDVRVLQDVLAVRVSTGQTIYVPISCYMQPPILDIIVPAVTSSIFPCAPGRERSGADCLELGARLLGDVHCVPVLYRCEDEHAAFFLISEDSWLSLSLDSLTRCGSVVAAPFVAWPARWRGGGTVRGCVRCRATAAGLHTAALRVVASTAVVRPLYLLADALYYKPEHITLEAQEKNYDICSADDPACEYYVHLGVAFPHRSLSATVQLVNHSPVIYNYYWRVRPWGACSCWEEEQASMGPSESGDGSERLCVGAKEARDEEIRSGPNHSKSSNTSYVRVEPPRGGVAPRAACELRVCAPDVGARLGVQRAVLMLVLQDIPKESLPVGYIPMITKTRVVESDPILGVKGWTREICEVVHTQMEVWWEVAPVRFMLDPLVLPLVYSRRINSLDVAIRATQLFGYEGVRCTWQVPAHVPPPPPKMLISAQSCEQKLKYTLPILPNEYPEVDVITLEAASSEWKSQCAVSRRTAARHPALRPARAWLGVRPPAARLRTSLAVLNDTYQHTCWWVEVFRWHGENAPHAACARGRPPCAACRQADCTCALVRPTRGALQHGQTKQIVYDVNTPMADGCVATLVVVRRTSADVACVAGGAGTAARAALLAYRVLAPRLVLRVRACAADLCPQSDGCALDEGDLRSERGAATLRPRAALAAARRACYRLRVSNLTPLPTRVTWDPPLEDDVLKVTFLPKEFNVGGHAQVEVRVILEGRKVCGRRLFVHRAHVQHAYKPVYLIIDTAISGLEILCEVPIGGAEKTDSTLIVRRIQAEIYPWESGAAPAPTTPKQIFEEEDRQRAERAERVCRCKYKMVYIDPVKRPQPPPQTEDDYPPVEIVCEPPPLTRVCPCCSSTRPVVPEHQEPACLQFHRLPLRTVRSRVVTIRNESVLSTKWSAVFRNWSRRHTRTLNEDQWASDVQEPGIVMQCTPSGGTLDPRGRLDICVQVYADCWGLYRNQLLIKIENLEPIVLDVWVEAVGAPLQFALNLGDSGDTSPVLCWMSTSDPTRSLRVKNTSRAELTVHTYTMVEHEYPEDELPFRLYLRFFDVLPTTCPCVALFQSESAHGESSTDSTFSSSAEVLDTGMEIYLGPDYGLQNNSFYQVTPETTTVAPGAWATWSVALLAPESVEAPPCSLVLRATPAASSRSGPGWHRPAPAERRAALRQAARAGRLRLSRRDVRVRICALDLPSHDVMWVRKRFRVQNVGNGPLAVHARTEEPWTIVSDAVRGSSYRRELQVPLYLLPRSSLEVCVEVRVHTDEAWPPGEHAGGGEGAGAPCDYELRRLTTTCLYFFDSDNVIKSIPLILEIEYPKLLIEPSAVDFGFVTDGDTRKSYFTVAHSSQTVSVEVVVEWVGGAEFRLCPTAFTLRPGARERVYVQYTARWSVAPVEGRVWAAARGGAGAWCRAGARARAAPARDAMRHHYTHDFTDDARLLPPTLHTPPAHAPTPAPGAATFQ